MTREEAIERFNGIINAMSISIAQSKFYPSKTELDELCDMAIEALSADAILAKIQIDDIDKAKTSSQLLDDLAVDMVKAMGKRIVEVVRCKDCRHLYNKDFCSFFGSPTDAMDYCSHGERKEP